MHPWITSDKPGTCPICGMELIKVSGEKAKEMQEAITSGVTTVSLSPLDRVKANVELGNVEEFTLMPEIKTFGSFVMPENAFYRLSSYVEGRIDRLYAQEVGAYISTGAKLMEIYSPDLVAAQEEFLISVGAKKNLVEKGFTDLIEGTNRLIESGRRKLKLLGMTDAQVKLLEEDGTVVDTITVFARRSGLVNQVLMTQGEYVMEGGAVIELANLSPIWVDLEIYEPDIPKVAVGDRVALSVTALGGKVSANGTISMFLPQLTEGTRTLKVRAVIDNPGYKFRPGMYVEGRILKRESEKFLVVPRDAVLISGKGARVWVPTTDDPDVYRPLSVTIGRIVGDDSEYYEVTEGLRLGQTVIRGATFLVDSEAQMMSAGAASDAPSEDTDKDDSGDNSAQID